MDDEIARTASTAIRWRAGSSPKPIASPTPASWSRPPASSSSLPGIPLYRLAYFQLTLHPEFAGKGYFWRRGHGVEVGEAAHGDRSGAREYLDNPLPPVFEQRSTVRVRLEQVEPQAPLLSSSRPRARPTTSPCRCSSRPAMSMR